LGSCRDRERAESRRFAPFAARLGSAEDAHCVGGDAAFENDERRARCRIASMPLAFDTPVRVRKRASMGARARWKRS